MQNLKIASKTKMSVVLKKAISPILMKERKDAENGKQQRIVAEQEQYIRGYDCQICGKIFRRKNSLIQHTISHITKDVEDNISDSSFKLNELKCEENIIQAKLVCNLCDVSCHSLQELRTHKDKHKPIRKTRSYWNTLICIDCKKSFCSVSSLKLHVKQKHKAGEIGEKSTTVTNSKDLSISIKQENLDVEDSEAGWNDLIHFTTRIISEMDVAENEQVVDISNAAADKPFACWKCGSRYKHEKSKILHEVKYHSNGEAPSGLLNYQSEEVDNSKQIIGRQLSSVNESYRYDDARIIKEEESVIEEIDNTYTNNNYLIPVENIKKENAFSLPVVNVSISYLPDIRAEKEEGTRICPKRQAVIKSRCIGCNEAFDSMKERDAHELNCELNYFNRHFSCMFCERPFAKPKTLRKHENRHRPVKKTKSYRHLCVCTECDRAFDTVYSLRIHIKRQHRMSKKKTSERKPYACRICKARFSYKNSICRHEMKCHSSDSNQTVKDSGENLDANSDVKVFSEGITAVMNDLEDSFAHYNWIKHEGDDGISTDTFRTLAEYEDVSPVYNKKTEADVVLGDAEVKDVVSSRRRRKRKAGKAMRKKPKKSGPYECNNCEAKFSSSQGLWLHSYHQNMRTKRLSCIGCGRTFKCVRETEEHEFKCDLNHNKYDFNCFFCDEPFRTPKLLRNHEVEHRPRKNLKNCKCVCIYCLKPFDSTLSLKAHVRDHRIVNNVKVDIQMGDTLPVKRRIHTMEEMMTCYVSLEDISKVMVKPTLRRCERAQVVSNVCDNLENFSGPPEQEQIGDLTRTIKEETNCRVSGADVNSEMGKNIKSEYDDLMDSPAFLVEAKLSNLREVDEMTAAEPFQCGECNAKFDSNGNLRRHSYWHRQRTKKLFCIGCGIDFGQSSERDRHELECRVNLTGKQFNCIFCELPFDTPQSLRSHENRHRPPKRCKRYRHMCLCAECNRAFKAIFTLKVHIRLSHRSIGEKVKPPEEKVNNFDSDLTFEEYKFGNAKVEGMAL